MSIIKTEKELLEAFGENPIAFYAALRMRMQHMDNKLKYLPPEELERLDKERLERRAEEARIGKIRSNTCPDCSGKLTRGKKCKRNNYKREYLCGECTKIHYV